MLNLHYDLQPSTSVGKNNLFSNIIWQMKLKVSKTIFLASSVMYSKSLSFKNVHLTLTCTLPPPPQEYKFKYVLLVTHTQHSNDRLEAVSIHYWAHTLQQLKTFFWGVGVKITIIVPPSHCPFSNSHSPAWNPFSSQYWAYICNNALGCENLQIKKPLCQNVSQPEPNFLNSIILFSIIVGSISQEYNFSSIKK